MLALLFAIACSSPSLDSDHPPLEERSHEENEGLVQEIEESETAFIRILNRDDCANPCTLRAESSTAVVEARYEADGWFLGYASDDELSLEYTFNQIGDRAITAFGLNADGEVVAEDVRTVEVIESSPDWPSGSEICENYTSQEAEWALSLIHI